ncbi:hypothetical protein FVE85_4773 [Porphyridium purpureum]|uniref:Uncharacterized protein n=1 Tax=Porphyridium purpureum TaxID=35688 RepID=A0A5J4YQU4_PORPP|nr:hypothetical protein FVE85_4773 [Porphyridium purpureum]|eukprot:POR8185..scf236_6
MCEASVYRGEGRMRATAVICLLLGLSLACGSLVPRVSAKPVVAGAGGSQARHSRGSVEQLKRRKVELEAVLKEIDANNTQLEKQVKRAAQNLRRELSVLNLTEQSLDDHRMGQDEANVQRMQQTRTTLENNLSDAREELRQALREKDLLSMKMSRLSLQDVLSSKSENWSPLSREMYKHAQALVPSARQSVQGARAYARELSQKSAASSVLVPLSLFAVLLVLAAGCIYLLCALRRTSRSFTVESTILVVDIAAAAYWVCNACLYVALGGNDALCLISLHHPEAFFGLQVIILILGAAYLGMRIVLVSITLHLNDTLELMLVLSASVHYFLNGWSSVLLQNSETSSSSSSSNVLHYVLYAGLFSVAALLRSMRVREYTLPIFADVMDGKFK